MNHKKELLRGLWVQGLGFRRSVVGVSAFRVLGSGGLAFLERRVSWFTVGEFVGSRAVNA